MTTITTKAIIEQLTENTGRHMLDSGGAYGRNWERNQGRDFEAEPAVTVEWSCYGHGLDMDTTVSLYHWMKHNFELDERLQRLLDKYAARHTDEAWLETAEGFAELLTKHTRFKMGRVINSYNHTDEFDLSQTIQYVELIDTDESEYEVSHYILQVHGGCDMRGGYSSPRVYKLTQEDYEVMDTARVSDIWCNGYELDQGQMILDGVSEKASNDGSNCWYFQGWRDLEPGDSNDCATSPFLLPCANVEDNLPIEPRNEWWVAVADKKAYLMLPGRTDLNNELKAGNRI